MDNDLLVESLPVLGVCNLCLNDGALKSIFEMDKKQNETYASILIKCFSIDVSEYTLGDVKLEVCEGCRKQLDAADKFRHLVENSLLQQQDAFLNQNVKLEDDLAVDNDNFLDEELIKYHADSPSTLIKKEEDELDPDYKIESKTKVTRSLKKLKRKSTKKELEETQTLLQNGLFPFKIRKNDVFACALCPEKSTNLDDIKNHITQHKLKYINMAFNKMLTTMQRFYKSDDTICCKLCLHNITSYEELKLHLSNCERLKQLKLTTSKWNILPFKLDKDQTACPICNADFVNFANLNSHMNEHFPNFICENCGKAFASKGRLKGHIRTHEIGEFPCKYCNQVFDKVTKRENHISKEHKSGIRYACKRCKITLTSFYARQKHMAEVHNEELKRYKCKACSQSYITPGHLSSHVRRDHLNERNHKCDKCELSFYSRNALKMHMIKHDGERIHTCHVCQKSYQRKKTLREHLRIHDNDKRFVCLVCGRAFTQKCTLKGHLRVHKEQIG